MSTSFSHSIRSRVSCSAETRSASPDAVPISQASTVTPVSAPISVPMRSGSPTNGSAPAARIASTRAGSRVVAAYRVTVRDQLLRQRERAPSPAYEEDSRHRRISSWSARTLASNSSSVSSGRPLAAADGVLGLEHLRHVVDVVLDLDLGRARRLPVEVVARRALREDPEQDRDDHEEGQEPAEHDGEDVHAGDATRRCGMTPP